LAVRALFLAVLAQLSGRALIRIARFKSNNDYAAELKQHAHVHADMTPVFRQCMGTYEAIWYGDHVATRDDIEAFLNNHKRICT
jgi:hypothetical protein